jgi:hypothetical protein
MKGIKLIAVIAILGVMPLSSHAASLTFNFGADGGIFDSRTFENGGIQLDVTAWTEDTAKITISQTLSGIGGCTSMLDCGLSMVDVPELDSDGLEEIMYFAASEAFYLDGLLFSGLDLVPPGENFILSVDGLIVDTFNPDENPFYFNGGIYVQSSFSIHATEVNNIPASFRLMQAYAHTDTYATALPEPGTLGMLVFGLAAVGLIRRRKSH